MTINCEIIDLRGKDKIHIDAPFTYKERIESIPGSKYDKKLNIWTVPVSWQSYLALWYSFQPSITFGPELTAWVNTWYTTRIAPAMALRAEVEAPGYPELYPHQRAGVQFLASARRAILADAPGVGKTAQAISAMRLLYERGENVFPALVISHNSAKHSWKREIEKFWPGLKVSVVEGTPVKKRKIMKEPAHVYIINWESVFRHSKVAPYGSNALKRCVECGGLDPKVKAGTCQVHTKELNEIDFNTVIADEAHKMKEADTITTRAVKAATGDAEFRFALTGTPISNHPGDIWSILNWLYPEGYPTKTKFIDRLLEVSYPIWGGLDIVGIKESAKPEFFGGLDPILRRMTKEAVLQFLPPKVYEVREVELSPKQRKAYDELEQNMATILDSGDMVLVESDLTKTTRMLQFASAYGRVETSSFINAEGEEEVKETVILTEPSAKIDAFMSDIEGFGTDSVVVFSPSKQVITLLANAMDKKKIKYGRITGDENTATRQANIDAFQKGKVQFILCTTGAGGISVTLTKASICVFLGRPWSNVDSIQAEDRTHRIGSEQHDSVLYIDYVSTDTIEYAIFDALVRKNMSLQEILRDKELMLKIFGKDKGEDKGNDNSNEK